MVTLIVMVVILVALAIWVAAMYNNMVALKNRFQNSFSQIDVQLKRRYDLVPNLVETAKAYMGHERKTLEAVIAARNMAYNAAQKAAANPADAKTMQALGAAETGLSGALSKFMAVSEAYPDLKANTTMLQLSEELTSTENKIAFARQAYNDSVMGYNTAIEQFPANLIASSFTFKPATLLESTEAPEERKAPKLAFS
jgi:LemA protein